jgi:hypothetical protein
MGRGEASGLKPWKPGNSRHDRKYLECWGDYVDPRTWELVRGRRIGFWGEWEPPSRVRAVASPIPDGPSFIHEPVLPGSRPEEPHQNTDPLMFGEGVLYSNCRQDRRSLKTLDSGSVVIFGRGSYRRNAYWMDTCLVIETIESVRLGEVETQEFGSDVVHDVVLWPLVSEARASGSDLGAVDYSLYRGVAPGIDPRRGPFSFFPAALADERPDGFARPTLSPTGPLEGLLKGNLQQGFTRQDATRDRLLEAWSEIVEQVAEAGLLLGVRAEPPTPDQSVRAEVR